MDVLASIVVWLNIAANALGKLLLSPIAYLPGWLSSTLVAAVLGLGTLVAFKYTSNQLAIRRVRDDITSHLLALKLFPDSLAVTFRAQGRILRGAIVLLLLAVRPMLVMIVPTVLLLGQLDQWYHFRPLRVGEEAVVTMKLAGEAKSTYPELNLSAPGVEILVGPVRILSRREICWNIQAREVGYHNMEFQVGAERVGKELAVGDGFMRVSAERPGWNWYDILCQPIEPPFRPGAAVSAIQIDYPRRESWTSGADYWLIYCFAASMLFALCFRPFFNVKL